MEIELANRRATNNFAQRQSGSIAEAFSIGRNLFGADGTTPSQTADSPLGAMLPQSNRLLGAHTEDTLGARRVRSARGNRGGIEREGRQLFDAILDQLAADFDVEGKRRAGT